MKWGLIIFLVGLGGMFFNVLFGIAFMALGSVIIVLGGLFGLLGAVARKAGPDDSDPTDS